MARTPLPDEMGIYRGDPWEVPFYFHSRTISGATFTCQLRFVKGGAATDVTVDDTHAGDGLDPDDPDNDNYIVLTLTGEETTVIGEGALLYGDLQEEGGRTIPFTVPIAGQYEVAP